MSWRTVIVRNKCKLSYKNDYMIIRNDEISMIHISEIGTLLIDSTMVTVTSYLLCELIKNKVKIIFCDEDRNPNSEVVGYYDRYNTSKKIFSQVNWKEDMKSLIWKEIIIQKIRNQASLLNKMKKNEYKRLIEYSEEVELDDLTNREGHSAKVYFNALFGKDFNRDEKNNINAALNYGYTLLLSTFNKEVTLNGYITQLGIKHKNEFNYFNLSCDLMEPFRIIVDDYVFKNKENEFDKDYKIGLIDLLNKKVLIDGKEHYLTNAIKIYTKNVLEILENYNIDDLLGYEF